MNKRQSLLLRTVSAALELNPSYDKLSSDHVNGLASSLGFGQEETLRLVEELKQEELVELHWPGKVSITGKGKAALNPRQIIGDKIHLGPGAVFVGGDVGPGAAVGQYAKASPVTIVEQGQLDLSAIVASLVAAYQQLIREQATLPAEAQQSAQHLAEETNEIQHEIRKSSVNKAPVEQRLDRAKGILEKLGGVISAGSSLKPAWELLHRTFEWLGTHLGSIAS